MNRKCPIYFNDEELQILLQGLEEFQCLQDINEKGILKIEKKINYEINERAKYKNPKRKPTVTKGKK